MAIRRREKLDHTAELAAWSMTFRTGFDFLKALPKIGVAITKAVPPRRVVNFKGTPPATPPPHQPARAVLESAWRRLGRAFLDSRGDEAGEAWAEREFGPPESSLASPRAARPATVRKPPVPPLRRKEPASEATPPTKRTAKASAKPKAKPKAAATPKTKGK